MSKPKYIKVIVDENAPTWEEICEKQKKWREEHDEEITMAMAISIRRQYNK